MKKTNNQGFSLVELIIVIAIMAVLVGVLAPQFIKYVEKTRVQKDASAVEELRNAVEVALSEDAVYTEISGIVNSTTPLTITVSPSAGTLAYSTTTVPSALSASITSSIKAFTFSSKAYTTATTGPIITVALSGDTYTVTTTPPVLKK